MATDRQHAIFVVLDRHDWLHGVALCPDCQLPLDRQRALVRHDYAQGSAEPTGGYATHDRCGAAFAFRLADAKRA